MFDGSSDSWDNRRNIPEERGPLLSTGLQQLDANVVSSQPAPKPPISASELPTASGEIAQA